MFLINILSTLQCYSLTSLNFKLNILRDGDYAIKNIWYEYKEIFISNDINLNNTYWETKLFLWQYILNGFGLLVSWKLLRTITNQ